MTVTPLNRASDLPTLIAAPRAVACLSVSWSMPERIARKLFQTASEELDTAVSDTVLLFGRRSGMVPVMARHAQNPESYGSNWGRHNSLDREWTSFAHGN